MLLGIGSYTWYDFVRLLPDRGEGREEQGGGV